MKALITIRDDEYMNTKINKFERVVFVICTIIVLGLLVFTVPSFLGTEFIGFIYLLFATPFLFVVLFISLVKLVINFKKINLRSFSPLIIILSTFLIIAVVLCITPGTMSNHEIGLYFFSKELFDCPLPPDSSLILKGSGHGNGSGTSNHCEHLAYIAISSDNSMDNIASYYENKLINKIDRSNLSVYFFDENEEYPFKNGYIIFTFTENQRNQLIKAGGQKKAIYLITAVKGSSPTCLAGH